jgi:ABC-type multidrug transport system ATPase subunit
MLLLPQTQAGHPRPSAKRQFQFQSSIMMARSHQWLSLIIIFAQYAILLIIQKLPVTIAAEDFHGNGNRTKSGLYWNNLSVQTSKRQFLLKPTHGFVADGHICGLLGPSGAGKSTFLRSVGGTLSPRSGLDVDGDIFYFDEDDQSREALHVSSGQVAWMQQKDSFFSMLTVQETLDIAAFLELPYFSKRQRKHKVKRIMDSLGLAKMKNRPVGEAGSSNALSGGERRRLSLALELISDPKLFVGDEPTSGLDSTLSEKVVRLIKKLVKQRNIPCILSIHQPSSSIWRMLDSVLLMAPGGRVCYMGDAHDAINYFASLGYQCPSETNPAEFLLDLVSVDSEDPQVALKDEARIARLAEAYAEREQLSHFVVPAATEHIMRAVGENNEVAVLKRKRHPFRGIRRFGGLLLRSWRQNIRNHRINLLRLCASIGNAYLFSTIFKTIQKDKFTPNSVADRTALLTFGVINMSMMALMKTIDLFAKEKPVVHREQQRRQYSSFEYLFSKAVAEIPLDSTFAAVFTTVLKHATGVRIGWNALTAAFSLMTVAGASLGFAIGALSPTGEFAMSAGVPVMVVLMTVGVINPSGVDPNETPPLIVQGLKLISPIAYAVKAVCLAEYTGMEFDSPHANKNFFLRGQALLQDLPKMGALALVQNGEEVLHELGLGDDSFQGEMRHLAVLSAVNLFVSWLGLIVQQRMV